VIPERRARERRNAPREPSQDRRAASASLDVTRIEHENLYSQVQQNAEHIRRLETELRRIRELLESLRLRSAS